MRLQKLMAKCIIPRKNLYLNSGEIQWSETECLEANAPSAAAVLLCVYTGSYTNSHLIWNLWNRPSSSFINFICNDHDCKILFLFDCFKWDFITLKSWHYFIRQHSIVTGGVMTLRASKPSVMLHVIIRLLLHEVSHWITATSYYYKQL